MANNSEIYNFAQKTKNDLFSSYIRSGLKASGAWGEALEQKVVEEPNTTKIQIFGLDYTEFILPPGRRANNVQSVDEAKKLYPIVIQWMRDKGLAEDKTFAFRIALKWVYKGIQVPNKYNTGDLIDSVINENWVQEGAKAIGGSLLTQVTSDIRERLRRV